MRIAPAVGRVSAVAVSATTVVLLGWLFGADVAAPAARLDRAIARSDAALDACSSSVRPEARRALRIYLAIEDFFRPPHVRAGEFLVARIGASVGLNFVETLGIGQISRRTYLSVAQGSRSDDDREPGWPARLQDDCANIAVLQLYADQQGVSCSGGPAQCTVLLACFWHTGRTDSCSARLDDRSYLANLLTTSVRITQLDLLRPDSSSKPHLSLDRAPQPRSAVLQQERRRLR